MKSTLAKLAVKLLQWGLVLAIVAYLVRDIYRNDSFPKLWNEPKQWHLLAAALAVTLVAVTLTIVRWHWLMRAHDLPLRLRDALRLGFLGFLLNFISLGAVGGDLFKAIFAARECHGRRTEAVATVILDRLIELYVVFVLGSGRNRRHGRVPRQHGTWLASHLLGHALYVRASARSAAQCCCCPTSAAAASCGC